MDLSADRLIADARRESGLHDFGNDTFVEPLSVLVRAINDESLLTEPALEHKRRELIDELVSRLRLQAYVSRHPEIEEQQVVAPVVIVGLQRSGTSKLFRAIASDPSWNVLTTWQGLNPAPLHDDPGDGPDPRIERARAWADRLRQLGLHQAHAVDAEAPEMEYLLLAKNFMFPSPSLIVPTHRRWCEITDYRPAYRYLRQQLQFLQWQNDSPPGHRWLLKYPFHLANLAVLVDTFPDAKLVMTHRHPAVCVASMIRIADLMQKQLALHLDRERISSEWLDIMAFEIRRGVAFRDTVPEGTILDVGYDAIVNRLSDAARRIYTHAGLRLCYSVERSLQAWEQENPLHRDGAFEYELADYGLTPADIEVAFAPYLQRFMTML